MNQSPQDERWNECPPGELRAMVGRIHGRQRRRAILRGGATSAVVALLVIGLAFAMDNPLGSDLPGGIACRDVHDAVYDYIADGVDGQLRQKIDAHLAECEVCREAYRQEQEKAAGISSAARVAAMICVPTLAASRHYLARHSPPVPLVDLSADASQRPVNRSTPSPRTI